MAGFRVWSICLLIFLLIFVTYSAVATEPVECWRGWGYRVDKQTRTYKSEELLPVTKGPADWRPGQKIVLYLFDRASGQIVSAVPPITIVPLNSRLYYRNNLNYVDGEGEIVGSEDNLVFGLNHVLLTATAIEKLHEYNLWACDLEGVTK